MVGAWRAENRKLRVLTSEDDCAKLRRILSPEISEFDYILLIDRKKQKSYESVISVL